MHPRSSQNLLPNTNSINIPYFHSKSETAFSSWRAKHPVLQGWLRYYLLFLWSLCYFCIQKVTSNSSCLSPPPPSSITVIFFDNVINCFYCLSSLLSLTSFKGNPSLCSIKCLSDYPESSRASNIWGIQFQYYKLTLKRDKHCSKNNTKTS